MNHDDDLKKRVAVSDNNSYSFSGYSDSKDKNDSMEEDSDSDESIDDTKKKEDSGPGSRMRYGVSSDLGEY